MMEFIRIEIPVAVIKIANNDGRTEKFRILSLGLRQAVFSFCWPLFYCKRLPRNYYW